MSSRALGRREGWHVLRALWACTRWSPRAHHRWSPGERQWCRLARWRSGCSERKVGETRRSGTSRRGLLGSLPARESSLWVWRIGRPWWRGSERCQRKARAAVASTSSTSQYPFVCPSSLRSLSLSSPVYPRYHLEGFQTRGQHFLVSSLIQDLSSIQSLTAARQR